MKDVSVTNEAFTSEVAAKPLPAFNEYVPVPRVPGKTGLSGSYSIGVGQTYGTVKAFFDDINLNGIDGNVTGNIMSDVTETATATLNVVLYGAGGPYTITLQPSGGSWKVEGNIGGALLDFNDADNVTIDGVGKTLKIRNQNTGGPAIQFRNSATYNTVKNCVVEGATSSTSSGVILLGSSTTTGNSFNTITNNDIRDRSDATGRPANGIYQLSTPAANNVTITNNNVFNFTSVGINANAGTGSNWVITGNSIYCAYAATTSQVGIQDYANGTGGGNHTISNNYIGGNAPLATGTWTTTLPTSSTFRGMVLSLGNASVSTISGNTIQNITNNGTGTGSIIGILTSVLTGYTTAGTMNVTNNTVTGITSSANSGTVGMQFQNRRGDVTVSGNTISNITQTHSSTAGTARGIVLADSMRNINWTISGNSIHGLSSGAGNTTTLGNVLGVYCSPTGGFPTGSTYVKGNTIYDLANTNSGTALIRTKTVGIAYYSVSRINGCEGNLVYNLSNNSGNQDSSFIGGILTGFTNSGPIIVQNNMVALGGNTSSKSGIYGIINIGGNDPDQMYAFANTVVISGTGTGTAPSCAFTRSDITNVWVTALYGSNTTLGTPILCKDNILINTRTGAGNGYAIGNASAPGNTGGSLGWDVTSSNYNVLYSTSANVGYWDVTAQTYSGWKTASGGDANSINANVNFVSGTDLHLASNAEIVHNAGIPIPPFTDPGGSGVPVNETGVVKDFDNADRSKFSPEIGADEDGVYPAVGAFNLTTPANNASPVSVAPAIVWSASENTSSYDLYLGTDNPPLTIVRSDLTSTSTSVGPLNSSTTYYWNVKAKGEQGSASFSANGPFTFTTGVPPATPTGFATSNVTNSDMDLSWNDVATNEDGYRVYRSTTGAPGSYTQVGTDLAANTNTYHDGGPLVPAKRYYYSIVPFSNAQGEGVGLLGNDVTLPVNPNAPTFGTSTYHTLQIITNAGGNDVDQAKVAIFVSGTIYNMPSDVTTDYYVQDDGTLGSNPVYKSVADWGGPTGVKANGFYSGTSYSVKLKAQNSDMETSELGSSANGTTQAPKDVDASPLFEQWGVPPNPLPVFPPDGWKIIDVDGDGASQGSGVVGQWHYSTSNLFSAGGSDRYFSWDYGYPGGNGPGGTGAYIDPNTNQEVEMPGDDHLISLPLFLHAGTPYNCTFWYRTVSGYHHNIKLFLGNKQFADHMTQTIYDQSLGTPTVYFQTGVQFSVPVDGIYYFDMYDYSDVNNSTIRIEDLLIQKAPIADLLSEKMEQVNRFPEGSDKVHAGTSVNMPTKTGKITAADEELGNAFRSSIIRQGKKGFGNIVTEGKRSNGKTNVVGEIAPITYSLKGNSNMFASLPSVNANEYVLNLSSVDLTGTEWGVQWTAGGVAQADAPGSPALHGAHTSTMLTLNPTRLGTYYVVARTTLAGDAEARNDTLKDWLFAYPGRTFVINYDSIDNNVAPYRDALSLAVPQTYAVRYTVPEGMYLHLSEFNTLYKNTASNGSRVTDSLLVELWDVATDGNGDPDYETVGALKMTKKIGGNDYLYNGAGYAQNFTIPVDDFNKNYGPGEEFILSMTFGANSYVPMGATDAGSQTRGIVEDRSYISDDHGASWTALHTEQWMMRGIFEPLNAVVASVKIDNDGDIDNTTDDRSALAGRTVTLYNSNAQSVASVQSDANGNAIFDPRVIGNLADGDYSVTISSSDSYVDLSEQTVDITLNGGTVNVEFLTFEKGSISGLAYRDVDGDGEYGLGEPRITDGRTITLSIGNVDRTTATDGNGEFSFTGVGPGTYSLSETLPDGWGESESPDDVTMSSGLTADGRQFGSYEFGSVSGVVYEDANGNGTKDNGEAGIADWTVSISVDKAHTGKKATISNDAERNTVANAHSKNIASKHTKAGHITVKSSSTTDENGMYSFGELTPASYDIDQQISTGYTQSEPANSGYYVEDIDGYGNDETGDDFGNYQMASISGTVYDDLNDNGTRQDGEPGVQGWVVRIIENGDSAVTDADGNYSFSVVPRTSIYSVIIDRPSGYIQTMPWDTTGYYVTAVSGEENSGNNFGIFKLGQVSGVVYNDANANGIQDNGETGIAGWTVVLHSESATGATVGSDVSDDNGAWSFSGLLAGNYVVTQTLQTGYNGFQNSSGISYIVTSGTNSTSSLFGVRFDTKKFRTIKSSAELSTKGVKLKFAKGVLKAAPNMGTALENLWTNFGKTGATVLGIPQTGDDAKKYAWITAKKASDLVKEYTAAATGQSYPLDSFRVAGKKTSALKGSVKMDVNKYNNVAWQEGITFNVNLMLSADSVTPKGFGGLVVDTEATLAGTSLKGKTLDQVGKLMDTVMTKWASKGVNTSAAYTALGNFAQFIKRINDGFYSSLSLTENATLDSAAIKGGKSFAMTLKGVKTAAELGLVKNVGKASEPFVPVVGYQEPMPTKVALGQNYPNPFNPTTTINVAIPEDMDGAIATVKVYNVLGQEVATILNNEELSAGDNAIAFDATKLSSGVYFYRLSLNNGEFTSMKKMMLLK